MTRSPLSRRTFGALALIAGIVLSSCADGSPSPGSTMPSSSAVASASALPSVPASEPASSLPSPPPSQPPPSERPTDSPLPFLCVPSVTVQATTDRAQITDVRVGTHDGYDRVTFEFDSGIPLTTIDGVLGPLYADPSDLPLEVAGTAFLRVVMNGGTKLTPAGGITYTGSTNFEPGFDQLLQLREGGDFEALSTWYLGLDAIGCYRVLTLSGPSRLVIDVEH